MNITTAETLTLTFWLVIGLCGCGTTTDRQTQTVERETLTTPPVVIDTPIGQFTVQPAVIVRTHTTDEVERSRKQIDMPEVPAVMQAVASSTPWGGIIGTVLGLGVASATAVKAIGYKRHRDELIDGIERAKDDLGDKWDTLTGHLEAEQSTDTKQAVKARVG